MPRKLLRRLRASVRARFARVGVDAASLPDFTWRKLLFPGFALAFSRPGGWAALTISPARKLAATFVTGEAPSPYARAEPAVVNLPPGLDGWKGVLARGPGQAPADDVAIFRNASIAAGGVIIAQNGEVVAESLLNTQLWTRFGVFFRKAALQAPIIRLAAISLQRRLSGRPHIMLKQTYDANYGHWLLEGLPRIVAAARVCDLGGCRVIVSRKSSGIRHVYEDSLAAFGVGRNQIVRHRNRLTHVDTLIYPLPISDHPFLKSPHAISILESIPAALGIGGPAPKRIYASRGGSMKRRLANEEELIEVLRGHGFEIVAPGGMSFAQQVQKFSRAEIIVGNCGANLTNLVFAPRGVTVLALTSQFMPDDFFWDLTDLKQGRFISLHGRALGEAPHGDSDFEIDPDQLKTVLRDILPGAETEPCEGTSAVAK